MTSLVSKMQTMDMKTKSREHRREMKIQDQEIEESQNEKKQAKETEETEVETKKTEDDFTDEKLIKMLNIKSKVSVFCTV